MADIMKGSGVASTGQASSLLGATMTPPMKVYRNPRAHIGQPERVSIEQIVEAYRSTGSVWKAARLLGIIGQSVWERLKAVDYPMQNRRWTAEELEELEHLSSTCTLTESAKRLGRPYAAVACMMSRKGYAKRFGNRGPRKLPRGSGLTQVTTRQHVKDLESYDGPVRQYCRMKGIGLEIFVQALQKYEMEFWEKYSRSKGLEPKLCPYCGVEFYPMSGKQKTCTRKCSSASKRDEQYFGGKRRNTIGLAEGICQLCQQPKKHLSAHHMLGKANDAENESLIALCAGCHQIVGILAGRKFADHPESWEFLITLVMLRRMPEHHEGQVGIEATVNLEWLTPEDIEEDGAPESTTVTVRALEGATR